MQKSISTVLIKRQLLKTKLNWSSSNQTSSSSLIQREMFILTNWTQWTQISTRSWRRLSKQIRKSRNSPPRRISISRNFLTIMNRLKKELLDFNKLRICRTVSKSQVWCFYYCCYSEASPKSENVIIFEASYNHQKGKFNCFGCEIAVWVALQKTLLFHCWQCLWQATDYSRAKQCALKSANLVLSWLDLRQIDCLSKARIVLNQLSDS